MLRAHCPAVPENSILLLKHSPANVDTLLKAWEEYVTSLDCKSEKHRSSQYRYARSITSRVARGICNSKELYDNETLLREYATGDLMEKLNKATRAHGFGLLRGDESGMLGVASFT